VEVRYLAGSPRSYQFNAGTGVFGIVNGDTLTKKGESFSFIPVAFRVFKDEIFNYGKKTWAEFFFTNDLGQMCSILFHGYSVENLNKITSDLFYDDANLCEVLLTVTPSERKNEAAKSSYFIADFGFKVLNKKEKEAVEAIGTGLNIYRESTITGDVKMELSQNYTAPIEMINGSGTAIEGTGEKAKTELEEMTQKAIEASAAQNGGTANMENVAEVLGAVMGEIKG